MKRPCPSDLHYNRANENRHTQTQAQIEADTGLCVQKASQSKGAQDKLLLKNRALEQELQSLRDEIVAEQNLKFQDWSQNEQEVADLNSTIKRLTQDQLQLESAKSYYIGRLRLLADMKRERDFELQRHKAAAELCESLE